MDFIVKSTNYCDMYRSNEEFGDWYEHNDINLTGLSISMSGYSDVSLFLNEDSVEELDEVYLVYVKYSSGDSFGCGTGYVQYLWVFKDRGRAIELRDLIEKDYKEYPEYRFEGLNKVDFYGVPISTSTWKGCFERLEGAYIEKLTVSR